MAANQTIMSLSDNQLDEVIKLLIPLDNKIDNRVQYAMQMAQDISSYRYGKHMTGFVNY